MKKNQEPRLAVLIDADNTSAKWAEAIFHEVARLGEASVRRIYGDFSGPYLRGWEQELEGHAVIPHQQFAYTQGKNSSDIALVIDAMDLLHTGRFDGFVLVSSDSDSTRLASRIREQGLPVYGIGKNDTPRAFRRACKQFIFIENLMPGVKSVPAPHSDDATKESTSQCGLARLGLRWDDVRGLRFVAGVVARLMSDEVSGGYKAALVGESGRICAADVAALDGRGRESRRRGGRAVERATVREAAGVGCEAAHRRTLSGTIRGGDVRWGGILTAPGSVSAM